MNKLANTKFQMYYYGLDWPERERFARRAGTTTNSIRANFLRPNKKTHPLHRKFLQSTISQPTSKTMLRLVKGGAGALTYEDMLTHFYRL